MPTSRSAKQHLTEFRIFKDRAVHLRRVLHIDLIVHGLLVSRKNRANIGETGVT